MQIILFPSLLPSFPSDPAFLSFAVSPPPFHPVFFFSFWSMGHMEKSWKLCVQLVVLYPFFFLGKLYLNWMLLAFYWITCALLSAQSPLTKAPQRWKAFTWYPVAGSRHRLALDGGQAQGWSWANTIPPVNWLDGSPGWRTYPWANGSLIFLKIFQTVKGE